MKGRLSLSIQKAMVPTLLHHTTELPTTVVASAEARRALEAAFSPQIAKDALETARLLITELVTNSVRHAVMPPGSVIRLEIDTNAARLRVEVHDAGRVITDLRPTEHPNEGGYGLRLVDQLADRWGAEHGDRSTCVWFELSLGHHS